MYKINSVPLLVMGPEGGEERLLKKPKSKYFYQGSRFTLDIVPFDFQLPLRSGTEQISDLFVVDFNI